MFFVLRRIALTVFGLMVAGLLLFLYRERYVVQPVFDYYALWRASRGVQKEYMGELTGQTIAVLSGDLFQVKGQDGFIYSFRLAGVQAPGRTLASSKELQWLSGLSRTNLASLILSNQVKVAFTYMSEFHGGVGLTYVNETNNVNARMLEAGLAWINTGGLRTLPVRDQYTLVLAERKAKAQKLGGWIGSFTTDYERHGH
jgi:endonuclease YncB( thermonuclease family)